MDVTMPQLGETVTEGTITRWLKQVGEHVDADEPLFEVSTDKVDSEVPAPVARRGHRDPRARGRDRRGRHPPRGGRRRGRRGGAAPRRAEPRSGAAPEPAPAAARPRRRPSPRPRPRRSRQPQPPPVRADARPAPTPEPAPPEPRPSRPPSPRPSPTATATPLTSPIVRRLVAERGLDPSHASTGSGPGGRITRKDVLDAAHGSPLAGAAGARRHRRARRAAPARARACRPRRRPRRRRRPRPAPAPAPAPRPRPRRPRRAAARRATRSIPFDNIRRRTAEHMVRSKATSAHVYTSIEVDFERVERVRAAHQARVEGERGLLAHLPAVHRARVLRHGARLPEGERERRRRRARRAPRRQPLDRGRPRLRGSRRAGDPQRRRQAAAADRA